MRWATLPYEASFSAAPRAADGMLLTILSHKQSPYHVGELACNGVHLLVQRWVTALWRLEAAERRRASSNNFGSDSGASTKNGGCSALTMGESEGESSPQPPKKALHPHLV